VNLTNTPVLVTGASGFMGAALCARLRRAGARVFAVSRRTRTDVGDGTHWLKAGMADEASACHAYHTTAMPQFGAQADRQMDRVCVARLERSRDALGWQPTTPLRNGLEQTVAWCSRWLTQQQP
jgi:nucleoside-diphosphate-sugar epimerase